MPTIPLTTLSDERVAVYSRLTEAQLRNRLDPDRGIFIAESPKVIVAALDAGYEPLSMLCEARHLNGDAAPILARCPELTTYVGERSLLASLTGYTLTRGVLCAMRRKPLPTVEQVCGDARRVVVIDGVVDTTNIGAIFRSAAALGIDGVLLTTTSCDPLNRRAIRVSMGTVFKVAWTWLESPVADLHHYGMTTVAMALTDASLPLDHPTLRSINRMAIVMGTEGDGLSHEVIASVDYVARIPMSHDVDSLNVAAAAAVAFWELRAR